MSNDDYSRGGFTPKKQSRKELILTTKQHDNGKIK